MNRRHFLRSCAALSALGAAEFAPWQAVVALLLGAAGVAVGGWGVWQVRQLQAATTEQLSDVPALAAQTLSIKQGEQQLLTRLNQLPSASELDNQRQLVVQLQGDQQRLNQRLETVLGESRKDWRLAEAFRARGLSVVMLEKAEFVAGLQVGDGLLDGSPGGRRGVGLGRDHHLDIGPVLCHPGRHLLRLGRAGG